MKKLITLLLFSISINAFSQQTDFEFLNSLPLKKAVEPKILNKYFFKTDTTANRNTTFRNKVKSKFLDKSGSVLMIILEITNGVCGDSYLYSFDKNGVKIDNIPIKKVCDRAEFLYTYKIDDNFLKINYQIRAIIEPTDGKPLTSKLQKEYNTYINLDYNGFFFEVSKENYSNNKRIFPESSNTLLNKSDLKNLTKDELSIARNEIFAAHGYKFNTERFRTYFNKQIWYKPLYKDVVDKLSEIEKKNIQLLKTLEEE